MRPFSRLLRLAALALPALPALAGAQQQQQQQPSSADLMAELTARGVGDTSIFAPASASSWVSSYESVPTRRAAGTSRGSAV